jgi:hypothetical protein
MSVTRIADSPVSLTTPAATVIVPNQQASSPCSASPPSPPPFESTATENPKSGSNSLSASTKQSNIASISALNLNRSFKNAYRPKRTAQPLTPYGDQNHTPLAAPHSAKAPSVTIPRSRADTQPPPIPNSTPVESDNHPAPTSDASPEFPSTSHPEDAPTQAPVGLAARAMEFYRMKR